MDSNMTVSFNAKDNLTKSVLAMQSAIQNLTQDILSYQKAQDKVFGKRIEIKYDLSKAKSELNSFNKEIKASVNGSQQAFEKQHKNLQVIEKDYKNLAKAVKEASNSEKTAGKSLPGSSDNSSDNGIVIGKVGKYNDVLKMLGTSVANTAGAFVTSRYGEGKGATISAVGGGLVSGAAAGTAIAPGIGTAIGAAVGAVSGLIDGMAKKIKTKDEFFKNEVKTIYDSVKQEEANTLKNGGEVAKKNEVNKVGFESLLGKDGDSQKFVDDIIKYSSNNSFKPDDALKISKKLLISGYKENEVKPFLDKLGNASASLGLGSDETNALANTLANAKSTNRISTEDLKSMDGYGLKASDALANFFKISKDELIKQITSGAITGEKASDVLTQHMNNNFQGGMEKHSKTYEGLSANVKEKEDMLDASMGEGYNEEHKKGLEKRKDYLDSTLGDEEKEAYRLIGVYKADLENKRQETLQNALFELMNENEDFKKADGSEKGRMIVETKAKAELEYKNSKEYTQMQASDLKLVQDLQGDVAIMDEYMKYGMKMAEQFTVGFRGGVKNAGKQSEYNKNTNGGKSSDIGNKTSNDSIYGDYSDELRYVNDWRFRAIGLDRVPYDNYPAILHEGERVLTRVEADQQSRVNYPVINMYNTVRDDADIDKIAMALATQLSKVQGSYGGAY